jgi:hypothetical protein
MPKRRNQKENDKAVKELVRWSLRTMERSHKLAKELRRVMGVK